MKQLLSTNLKTNRRIRKGKSGHCAEAGLHKEQLSILH